MLQNTWLTCILYVGSFPSVFYLCEWYFRGKSIWSSFEHPRMFLEGKYASEKRHMSDFIRCKANAWSNIAYYLIPLEYYFIKGTLGSSRTLHLIFTQCIAHSVASFLWHSSLVKWVHRLDIWLMKLYGFLPLFIIADQPWLNIAIAFISFLDTHFPFLGPFSFYENPRHSEPAQSHMVSFFSISTILLVLKTGLSDWWYLLGIPLTWFPADYMVNLDKKKDPWYMRTIGPDSIFSGTVILHVFSAQTLLCLLLWAYP